MIYASQEPLHTRQQWMRNATARRATGVVTLAALFFGVASGSYNNRHGTLAHTLFAHAAMPQASAATRPRAVVQPVSSDALPQVPGKRITTVVVEFPPGGYSPPHHHGGSVTVYVLSGAIRSQLQGQSPMVYQEGASFFEPPGVVHLLAENVSATEPARILAIFVADEGVTLTTYHE